MVEIFISPALGAAEQGLGWSFLATALQPLAISFVYHGVLSKYFFVCQGWEILLYRVQIKPLYNTIKGFIYMHPITHTYKQAVLALCAVWDDKNNHTS